MLKIAVIDGQGGGIGAVIIKRLKETFGENVEVLALGTNAIATAQMMKARANRGATGENAITFTAGRVDVIIGPISIILADAMMGEVTPRMAQALTASTARKLLLPLTQENVEVIGVKSEPLPHQVDDLIENKLKPWVESHV
jgi:hypothetical protein